MGDRGYPSKTPGEVNAGPGAHASATMSPVGGLGREGRDPDAGDMVTIRMLGYAGLLPFLILPWLHGQPALADPARALLLFQLYSCLILGFMAGVLWPALYHPDRPQSRALLAVSFPVASLTAFALWLGPSLLLQGLLFLLLRLAEQASGIDALYAPAYRSLRWQLTVVVVACHAWLFILT